MQNVGEHWNNQMLMCIIIFICSVFTDIITTYSLALQWNIGILAMPLHDITTQKVSTWISTTVETSNLVLILTV